MSHFNTFMIALLCTLSPVLAHAEGDPCEDVSNPTEWKLRGCGEEPEAEPEEDRDDAQEKLDVTPGLIREQEEDARARSEAANDPPDAAPAVRHVTRQDAYALAWEVARKHEAGQQSRRQRRRRDALLYSSTNLGVMTLYTLVGLLVLTDEPSSTKGAFLGVMAPVAVTSSLMIGSGVYNEDPFMGALGGVTGLMGVVASLILGTSL